MTRRTRMLYAIDPVESACRNWIDPHVARPIVPAAHWPEYTPSPGSNPDAVTVTN